MAKREEGGINSGVILIAPILGAILYIAFAAGIILLFMSGIIPIELMGLISKFMLFVISLFVCKIIKRRTGEEKFIGCMLGAVAYCILISLVSVACGGWKIDVAGFIICVLICAIGCFLLFVKDNKYGKMHKKRRKH